MAGFNFQTEAPTFQLANQQMIQGASKSPFSIAGEAMNQLNDDLQTRIYSKRSGQAGNLQELSQVYNPQTKESQAIAQQRGNLLNQIGTEQNRDALMGLKQDTLDETIRHNMATEGMPSKDYRPTSIKEYEFAVGKENMTKEGFQNFINKRYSQANAIKDEFGNVIGYKNVGKNIFGGQPKVPVVQDTGFKAKNEVQSVNPETKKIFSKAKVSPVDIQTYDTIPLVNNVLEEMESLIPTKVGDSKHFGLFDALRGDVAGTLGVTSEKTRDIQKVKSLGSKILGMLGKEEMKGVLSDQDLKIINQNIPDPYDEEGQVMEKWKVLTSVWKAKVDSFNKRMEMSGANLEGKQADINKDEPNSTDNRPSRTINGVTKYWDGKQWGN